MHFPESVRHWWRNRSSRRQFAALDSATIAALARDNAVSEAVLHRLVLRGESAPPLLDRRLERLGIDPEQLARRQAGLIRDMVGICAECPLTRRCRRDLKRRDFPLDGDQYCPNTETIETLRPNSGRIL